MRFLEFSTDARKTRTRPQCRALSTLAVSAPTRRYALIFTFLLLSLMARIAIQRAQASEPTGGQNYVGINAEHLHDTTDTPILADIIKTYRFIDTAGDLSGSDNGPRDAQGWPTQDFTMFLGDTYYTRHNDGTYALRFNGQGVIQVSDGILSVTNQNYNASTNTTTATLQVAASGIRFFTVTNTIRNNGGSPNTGITNIQMMRPLAAGSSSSYPFGTTFTNQEKAELSKFNVIRFMDWAATNGNITQHWNQRVNPTYATWVQSGTGYGWQGKGSPWEIAVQLANETNSDLWVNVPALADDDYVTKLAQLIQYGSDGVNPYSSAQANPVYKPLNANLKVYVEYSNEVWNFGFAAYAQNVNLAVQEVLAGGSPLNFDNLPLTKDNNGNYNSQYTWGSRRQAQRPLQISSLFRAVFGDAAMITRVRPLFQWQYGNAFDTGNEGLRFLDVYYNNGGGNYVSNPHPVPYYLWGGGSAAYYNPNDNRTDTGYGPNNLNDSDTLTVDFILQSVDLTQYTHEWDYMFPDVAIARAFGLHRTAYEGGLSFGDDSSHSAAAKAAAKVDPRLKQVVINNQNVWSNYGGDLLTYFEAGSDLAYGFTDEYFSLNTQKLQGIDAITGAQKARPTLGTPVPATIDGSFYNIQSVSYASPSHTPLTNFGTAADRYSVADYAGYLINVPSDGTYNVKVNYTSSVNGGVRIAVDGNDIGVVNVSSTGGTAVNSGAYSVTLKAGLSSVRLSATAGSGVFTINSLTIAGGGGGGGPTAPAAPTNLTASAGNAQVGLSWTASAGATSYSVYRGTSAGGESGTAIATGLTGTSYTNTGLTNGTTYYYQVKAVNSAGTSGASNEAAAQPVAPVSAATQINAGGGAVAPFVADANFSGGLTANNYTGSINTAGVTNPAPQAVYQSERYGNFSYTLSGLTAGASYTVRLHFCENYWTAAGQRTFNVAINGSGVLSGFDIFATAGAAHKAVVKQFTATANSSGQIVVAFTTVVNNALVNGLEVTSSGGGGPTLPATPTGLTATAGNAQVSLRWNGVSGATSYNLYRSTTAGGEGSTPFKTGLTTTSLNDTGLTNGTTYYYQVSAVNSAGQSGKSSEASAKPTAPAKTNLLANPGFETGDFAYWDYYSYVSPTNSAQVTTGSPHTGTYSTYLPGNYNNIFVTVNGLLPNTSYTLSVWARLTGTENAAKYTLYVNGYGGSEVDKAVPGSATAWGQYSLTFTTGAGATSAKIGFGDFGGSSVQCYIDDFTLTQN